MAAASFTSAGDLGASAAGDVLIEERQQKADKQITVVTKRHDDVCVIGRGVVTLDIEEPFEV